MNNNGDTSWQNKITRFLIAQTFSMFGSSLVQYAIIWYITLETKSGVMMMMSTICGFLPQILVSFFAGVWIDRYNRKKLIMISDSAIALATLALAIFFLAGFKSVWLIFAVLFIRSAGTGIQTPAVNAIIPQIVPSDKLMKINGINSMITSVIMLISPAAGGAILSFASIETTFFIDVITAIIGVAITYFIAIKPHNEFVENKNSSLSDLKNGFKYLKENKFIKDLLIFQLVIIFLISPSAFLLPLLVARTFGPEIWRLSLTEITFSVGIGIGGILISLWGGFKNRIKTTITAGLVYGILSASLGLSYVFGVMLFFNILIGIVVPLYTTPITVLIQEKVDTAMQGRVFSFVQISTSCAFPLGMVLFGPLADIIRVQPILIGTGILIILVTIHTLFKLKSDSISEVSS